MPLRTVKTTCPYCGVGCGVQARTDGDRLIIVSGDPEHPANRGRLCVKGAALPDTQLATGRLRHPEIGGRRVGWETALDHVAEGFRDTLLRHGPDAVAFYLSGQLLTEDYYVANKLMKGFLGGANVDTNSRLCMASAVAAQQHAFGEDVVPCDYEDLDHCELIVLVGSNAAWTHPVLYQRLAARRAAAELKVVVIDPRRTATCDIADLHLAIRPGADAVLFNALLVQLHRRGVVDEAYIARHTTGIDAALRAARSDADAVAERTGLAPESLVTFFDWFAGTEKVVTFFSQGVNQASNGTDKAGSIINVHLATGRIGKPGMGPFSITGQPNAMGGREVGGMANQLAAHQGFDADSRRRVGRFWGATNLPAGPGLKAVDLFDAVARGEVKAIWIMGTNPAVSLPRAASVGRALAACPLVVVSDCMADTETTRHADVLLPAQGWGEKDGTVTNSERCISRQRAFLTPVGEARPDWWIVCEVARRLGHGAAFDFRGPADIFREHAALSGFEVLSGRTFNLARLAGLSDAGYRELPPTRWPDRGRPFADGRYGTASGRARFMAVGAHRPLQQPDRERPFILNSGRLRDQWHTMTRTGLAPKLLAHSPAPLLAMHPADATALGLTAGTLVEARNSGGRIRGLLHVTGDVQPGQLFFPIHWNGTFAAPCRVSDLVAPVIDPVSGQPESKHAVVSVHSVPVARWVRMVSRDIPQAGCGHRLTIVTPGTHGMRTELALAAPLDLTQILATCGRGEARGNLISLDRPGEMRWLVEQDGTPCLAGTAADDRANLPSFERLESWLAAAAVTWQTLSGLESAINGSPLICTCFEIREDAIRDCMAGGAVTATALGEALGCGTSCGSCLPELNSIIAKATPTPADTV